MAGLIPVFVVPTDSVDGKGIYPLSSAKSSVRFSRHAFIHNVLNWNSLNLFKQFKEEMLLLWWARVHYRTTSLKYVIYVMF